MNTLARMVPQAWLTRARASFGLPLPGWESVWEEWVDLAVRALNYDFPVLNPIDSNVKYRPYGRPFAARYVVAMTNMARAQLFYSRDRGTVLEETFVPLKSFMSGSLKTSRDFQKARAWGLIKEAPASSNENKLHSGRWRLTDLGWLFLAGHIRVAQYAHILCNNTIGFSGPLVGLDDALLDRMGYKWSDSIRPPRGETHDVTCDRCGAKHLSVFMQVKIEDKKKLLCLACVMPVVNEQKIALMGDKLVSHMKNVKAPGWDMWETKYICWCSSDPKKAPKEARYLVRVDDRGFIDISQTPWLYQPPRQRNLFEEE